MGVWRESNPQIPPWGGGDYNQFVYRVIEIGPPRMICTYPKKFCRLPHNLLWHRWIWKWYNLAVSNIDNSTMKSGRWVWLPTTCSWTGLFLLKTTSTNGRGWWIRATTKGFGDPYATIDINPLLKWHSQRDLNPQIFWFVARYSIQLNYGSIEIGWGWW